MLLCLVVLTRENEEEEDMGDVANPHAFEFWLWGHE